MIPVFRRSSALHFRPPSYPPFSHKLQDITVSLFPLPRRLGSVFASFFCDPGNLAFLGPSPPLFPFLIFIRPVGHVVLFIRWRVCVPPLIPPFGLDSLTFFQIPFFDLPPSLLVTRALKFDFSPIFFHPLKPEEGRDVSSEGLCVLFD